MICYLKIKVNWASYFFGFFLVLVFCGVCFVSSKSGFAKGVAEAQSK